ncbi:hypothetical protein FHG87_010304 [Trinorchestia longiramus]|nr:hypothetical protein FHG87_010304 [Trinorchestia longiramus]
MPEASNSHTGTKVEPTSSPNLFTKLKSYFTSWSWSQDEDNSDDMKIQFEEKTDPIEEAAADLMRQQLLEKLRPVLTDTFGHSNITANEFLEILENPISIAEKLVSRTSDEHARELTNTFSFFEGLPHSHLVEKLAETNVSSMTELLTNVGAEIRKSLFTMLGPADPAVSVDPPVPANRNHVSAPKNVIQPKNINFSFAITSNYKNASFFGGNLFKNYTSSFSNFTKNPLSYTKFPSLYGINLAALPILATLTTGALFGFGGVLAILLASNYHYGKKDDYDYDEGYGHSTGYGDYGYSNPVIISIPPADGKDGYGSHSSNVKLAKSKSVRGRVKKGNRVRPHRGTSHRPQKHGGGGGGYSHHRHDQGNSYFYKDDFGSSTALEKINWKRSRENYSPSFVRLPSKEVIETSPTMDSFELFESSYEKKILSREYKWIYESEELRDKRKKQVYSGEIFVRSSEKLRNDKRDIFESWEKGRKSIYEPLKKTNNRPSNRRRQPIRKNANPSSYRGTLILKERSPLEDIFYGKNSRRRSSSKGKRKSSRDRDNMGQHSSLLGTRVAPDGGSPLTDVGSIPGIEWTLDSMSSEAGSAAKDLVIMSDNPLDERWRSRESDEDMFKADSTLDARRKLNVLLDRYRQYTRDVFIDGKTMPMAQPLAAQPPTPAAELGLPDVANFTQSG